jgi:hypothetical protein
MPLEKGGEWYQRAFFKGDSVVARKSWSVFLKGEEKKVARYLCKAIYNLVSNFKKITKINL